MLQENLIKIYEKSFREHRDLPALTDYTSKKTVTYGELARDIAKMHIIFKQCGIKQGDKIALLGKNTINWVTVFTATITYGAVIVPILSDFNPTDATHIINHSEATLLFVGDRIWDSIEMDNLKHIRAAVSLESMKVIQERDNESFGSALRNISRRFRSAYPQGFSANCIKYPDIDNSALAELNYTSGTTGFSKGVMLTLNNLTGNVVFGMQSKLHFKGSRCLSFLPLAHAYGCAFDMLTPLATGTHITLLGKIPSPKILVAAMNEVKPDLIICVPLVLEKIYRKMIQPMLAKNVMRWALAIPYVDTKIYSQIRNKLIAAFGGNFSQVIVGGAPLNAEVEEFLLKIKFPFTVGYGMTEFLVQRSYADRYNLIACAIGHHVMETRWLRDTTYLHQILNTWYHGNEGKPMQKMVKFSSWNPAAVYEAYKVHGDKDFLLALKPSLEEEYARWQSTNRLDNGLYWQGDVQDGMEESISGGRKKKYARPTINSYMFGNAQALAAINALAGDQHKADSYSKEAQQQKSLIENKLWNSNHQFFETMRGDTLAAVREAIGFIPWYFNMPEAGKYDEAWKQVEDEKGFSAPYGLTTAERRHPQFRSHGTGTCEWDGAIWPFASSQTLTAMINYINNYPQPVVGKETFFKQMKLYVESQHHRGRPYIGEYLDETNGAWLMGDRERSRYYNHSTFNDLVITGIAGIRPQADGSVEINPLVPAGQWPYFCLDNVSYHGHALTVIYDHDGQRYHQGKGLTLLVDGKKVAQRKDLGKLTYRF